MPKQKKQRRLKLFPVLVCAFVIVAVTLISISQLDNDIAYLEDLAQKTRLEQIALEAQVSALTQELSIADTDSYVIDVARSQYGYLMPGEIRFHVTNIDDILEDPEVEIVEVGS